MFFERLKVFLTESQHLNGRALVLLEFELDVYPECLDTPKSIFHLLLLFGLIANFFDIIANFTKFQIVDILEFEVLINHEVA